MLGAGDLTKQKADKGPVSSDIEGTRATLGMTLIMNLLTRLRPLLL